MTIPRLQESPIDHHIQAKILQKLFSSDSPVSFSNLKPGDIENSLFMYHVRKLEDRGLIIRSDKGFKLTPDGARWVNFSSPQTLKSKLVPRMPINLIITTKNGDKVVVSRRTSAVSQYLTRFLLPSGFHQYNVPIREAVKTICKWTVGATTELEYIGTYEIIYRFKDGYVHHWVLPTFHGVIDEIALPAQEHYEPSWVPIKEVIDNKEGVYDEPLPRVLGQFASGDKFNLETMIIDLD